jgi:two-component system nitrate/nitrite response regulator NarL
MTQHEAGPARPAEFEVALLVRDVTAWDDIDADLDFDILILRFGDVGVAAADRLARHASRHGKKILLLLNGLREDMLGAIAAIPSNGFVVQEGRTTASLAAAVARVTDGDAPMPAVPAMPPMPANRPPARARSRDAPGAHLTPRERQVLDLLIEGLGNKQIARRLRISQHGVKRLVSNVLAKLNCPNRTRAVAVALTEGIVGRP